MEGGADKPVATTTLGSVPDYLAVHLDRMNPDTDALTFIGPGVCRRAACGRHDRRLDRRGGSVIAALS